MSRRLKQWGTALLVFGIFGVALPQVTGLQLKIFNLFGGQGIIAAAAASGLGLLLIVIGFVTGSKSKDAVVTSSPSTPDEPPAMPVSNAAPTSRFCEECGAEASPGDRFCMECGTPLATPAAAEPATGGDTPAAAKPARSSSGRKVLGCLGIGCLVPLLLLAGGIAWLFWGGSVGKYAAPTQQDPAMPTHMAGTLTEFPVDPASTTRMIPTNVVSQTFGGKGGSGQNTTVTAAAETFPPGIDTTGIPAVAQSMTSATYRSDPGSAPVNIHVMQTRNPNVTSQYARGIARASGGQLQNTNVRNPRGQTYQGFSVRSSVILVYILFNSYSGNLIIIYCPEPSGFEATRRLASSVGNGQGLRAYPQVAGTMLALPARPPRGYQMTNFNNFAGEELSSTLNQSQSTMGPDLAGELGKLLELVSMMIPERGTLAEYRNAAGDEKGVMIGNYGSERKALVASRLISLTFGRFMEETDAAGFEAMSHSGDDSKVMVFRKGPFIGLSVVPESATDAELAELARSLQF